VADFSRPQLFLGGVEALGAEHQHHLVEKIVRDVSPENWENAKWELIGKLAKNDLTIEVKVPSGPEEPAEKEAWGDAFASEFFRNWFTRHTNSFVPIITHLVAGGFM
jgi:hypothetical protein